MMLLCDTHCYLLGQKTRDGCCDDELQSAVMEPEANSGFLLHDQTLTLRLFSRLFVDTEAEASQVATRLLHFSGHSLL